MRRMHHKRKSQLMAKWRQRKSDGFLLSSRLVPLSLILFSGVLLTYLSLRTVNYYWDGISIAYDIEHPDGSRLLHPNHLLYGALGYAVWSETNKFFPGV